MKEERDQKAIEEEGRSGVGSRGGGSRFQELLRN